MLPRNDEKRILFANDESGYRYREPMPSTENTIFHQYADWLFAQLLSVLKNDEELMLVLFYDRRKRKRILGYPASQRTVILTDNKKLIKRISLDALSYKVFPMYINRAAKMVVTPTDHLDLFAAYEAASSIESFADSAVFTAVDSRDKENSLPVNFSAVIPA